MDFIAFSITKKFWINFGNNVSVTNLYSVIRKIPLFVKQLNRFAKHNKSLSWSLGYLQTFRIAFYFRDDRFHTEILAFPHQNTFGLINVLFAFRRYTFSFLSRNSVSVKYFRRFALRIRVRRRVCVFILLVAVIGLSRHLMARDFQAFLVFSQHPAWFIAPVNP